MLSLAVSTRAASDSWTGTTDSNWATATNWSTATSAPGAGETATFNGAGNGNTTIDLGAGVTVGALLFDTSSAAAYTIGSGAAGSQTLTLGSTLGNVITMNADVTADQLFNAKLALATSSTANNTGTYYRVTNNSATNTLTLAGGISASTTGVKTLQVSGSGDTAISGAITSGSGNVAIFKTGSGTLTLSGGATFSGAGITDGANFTTSAVFREGTTILNGGTYSNSNMELVVGGVASHGGTGTNTTLQLDNGATLTGMNWLSIGRGNGTGNVSSDLVLNGTSSVSTERLSAGFNAANGTNLPKGSITLNGMSKLTATNTQLNVFNFNIAESAGSDISVTVNDSAEVNKTGGSVDFGNQTQGAVQIGREGKGTVTMNGGTFNAASTDLGRGVNSTTAQNGTLTIKTGATYNNEGDFRTGFAGGASGRAALNVEGGTLNIGSTTKRKMVIGTWDSSQSTVNVLSGGKLNLNTNTDIRFVQESNIGPNVMNLESGGAITSYSDNQTTANGAGVLDLMWKGAAGSNNTFNLNGGTLAVRQVVSTTNNGTRTFNFNGGTLRATGDTTAFFNLGTGSARANVRNDGAIIDTNGFNTSIGQALLHSNIGGDNAIDGGLTKTGSGTLTLTGTNTYTGATTINSGGTLALSGTGSIAGSSEIIVNGALDVSGLSASTFTVGSGQRLSGDGTVNATGKTVSIAGTHAVGNSPGQQDVTGNLHYESGSIFEWDLNAATSDPGAFASNQGTYDQVAVSGNLTGENPVFQIVLGSNSFSDAFWNTSKTWSDIFTADNSFDLATIFTSFDGSGVDASGLVAGRGTFSFTGGNTLTWSALPEPSSLLAGLLLGAGLLSRRR